MCKAAVDRFANAWILKSNFAICRAIENTERRLADDRKRTHGSFFGTEDVKRSGRRLKSRRLLQAQAVALEGEGWPLHG